MRGLCLCEHPTTIHDDEGRCAAQDDTSYDGWCPRTTYTERDEDDGLDLEDV